MLERLLKDKKFVQLDRATLIFVEGIRPLLFFFTFFKHTLCHLFFVPPNSPFSSLVTRYAEIIIWSSCLFVYVACVCMYARVSVYVFMRRIYYLNILRKKFSGTQVGQGSSSQRFGSGRSRPSSPSLRESPSLFRKRWIDFSFFPFYLFKYVSVYFVSVIRVSAFTQFPFYLFIYFFFIN